MDLPIFILLSVVPALAIVGGLNDLTTMKIPNWISGLLVLLFVPTALAVGISPSQIAVHWGIGFAALAAGMGMFALRWLGGGDAKLLASICLWLGMGSGMFLLWTAVVGGLFALVLLISRERVGPLLAGGPAWVGRLMEPKGDIPYGVAIAAGALLAWPASPLMVAFWAR